MEKKMPELIPERYFEGVYYYKISSIKDKYLAICEKYWNGEKYDAWLVDKKLFYLNDVRARPIYRWEAEDIDFLNLEEGSDEYDVAMELVDFELYLQ